MFSRTLNVAARSTTLTRLSTTGHRTLHATSLRLAAAAAGDGGSADPAKVNSQGHATRKSGQGLDVQSDNAAKGIKRGETGKSSAGDPYDTAQEDKAGESAQSTVKQAAMSDANTTSSQKAFAAGSFKDHRGGAQTDGKSAGEVGGAEEATSTSFTGAVKQALGMGASKMDHQESKTGPGVKRQFHSSARRQLAPPPPGGDASDGAPADGQGSRKPKDPNVLGDQNPHLKHRKVEEKEEDDKKSTSGSSSQNNDKTGFTKGGARAYSDQRTDTESQRKARFHTSARQLTKDSQKEKTPGGYVQSSTPPGSGADKHDVPGEAYPSPDSYKPLDPVKPGLKASSDMPHASTSAGPRHETQAEKALKGGLAERNPPPSGKVG